MIKEKHISLPNQQLGPVGISKNIKQGLQQKRLKLLPENSYFLEQTI